MLSSSSYLELDVEARLVEVQLRLEAERVKLLGDDQGPLRAQSHSQLSQNLRWFDFVSSCADELPRLFGSRQLSAL